MKNYQINLNEQEQHDWFAPGNANNKYNVEAREDSYYVLSWQLTPPPENMLLGEFCYFNDLVSLAYYIKYRLFPGNLLMSCRNFPKDPDMMLLSDYMEIPSGELENYTDVKEATRRMVEELDRGMDGTSEEEQLETIRKVIKDHNEAFADTIVSFGFDVVHGKKELEEFFLDENRFYDFCYLEEEVADFLGIELPDEDEWDDEWEDDESEDDDTSGDDVL